MKKNRECKKNGKIKDGGTIVGKVDGNQRGFAFLLSEKGDLFIPKDKLSGARHGDTVKAVRIGDKAEVKEVLARGTSSLVGTYYDSGAKGFVVPDDSHFSTITVKAGRSKTGEKVVVAFDVCGEGKIIEALGAAGDEGVDIKSVVRSFDLHEKFPRTVLKEADRLQNVSDEDTQGREDFRKEIAFTIDGEDSRDFDDAVSIKKVTDKSGENHAKYILKVHIADVAHYVAENSHLDKEAFERATSVYFPFAVIPMLPDRLSEDLCSLKEGEDRLTLSVVMHIDGRGEVVKHKICEGVINCCKRLTYTQAADILAAERLEAVPKELKPLAKPLKDMHDLCLILLNRRRERGAIDFESDEPEIKMDGMRVLDVKKADRLITHRMIEEFMVLTNETVAKHFFKEKTPFVYRGHAAPPEEKLERLTAFLASIGVSFVYGGRCVEGAAPYDGAPGASRPTTPAPSDFAALLENAPADLKGVISAVALRSMTKALYEPASTGHYGLALRYYCHFTAPIRRYPDLFIHRVIKAFLRGQGSVGRGLAPADNLKKYRARAAEAAKQGSLREKSAEEAERRINDLLTAKFMSGFVGEVFDGIVSGVTAWGVFVRLSNTAEGLIRIEKLAGQYVFDEKSMSLSGERVYKMGQRVRVRVVGVSGDRIEFAPVTE
ncbi:MAG: ribonuclease R [Firmicutes bacterium]|nr:ribonuclease R [Bacillota bacterium]